LRIGGKRAKAIRGGAPPKGKGKKKKEKKGKPVSSHKKERNPMRTPKQRKEVILRHMGRGGRGGRGLCSWRSANELRGKKRKPSLIPEKRLS